MGCKSMDQYVVNHVRNKFNGSVLIPNQCLNRLISHLAQQGETSRH